MHKHTPGPWRAYKNHPASPWWTVSAEGSIERDVADIRHSGEVDVWNDPTDPEVAEANARLIAKAWIIPELLEALRDTLRALEAHLTKEAQEAGVSRCRLCPCMGDEAQRARAAIAKAEG